MAEQFIEELEVDLIRQRHDLNADQKRSSIHDVRSFAKKKNKSYQTISSIANAMVGSSCLVLPLLFRGSGLISSLLIMSIIGWVSYKTCDLIVVHTREKDNDLPFVLERVLGKKFFYAYCGASSFLLFFVSIIFYILMCNMLYLIITFFIDISGNSYYKIGEKGWDQFSFQYASIIGVVCVFSLMQIKNLRVIVKLGEVGILALISYTIFLVVRAFMQIGTGVASDKIDEIQIFTSDFKTIIDLCGAFALSFCVHNAIVPIMKHNEFPEKNSRDLGLGYALAGGVYTTIGVLGCFAIVGRSLCSPSSKSNTVMECFERGDVSALVIEILFLFHLVTVIPLVSFISRMQCLQICYETEEAPFIVRMIFNIIFATVCLLLGIFNVDPTLIIAFTGAICGFFIVYIVPIGIHLRCIYKEKEIHINGETDNSERPLLNEYGSTNKESVCDHEGKVRENIPLWARLVFYGIIMAIGLVLIAIQLYQFADLIKEKYE